MIPITEDRFPGQVRAFRTMKEAEILPHFAPRNEIATRIKVPLSYVLRHRIHQFINFREVKK